ncbi:MAG TPA: response regulator [Polyangiales bacterium]|nr:response regulator [Polyangiales bacterium]
MQVESTHTADILVVDDNPANVVAIEAALGDLGARVVRAHSGGEALRILLERDFALILLDVKMPTMDGFETARMIRARKRSSHTPIIFITAHGRDDREVQAAYALGAVDFLFKPVIPEVLRAKATVFVELQQRTAEVARQAEQIREHERREHERSMEEERSRWEAESLLRQMEQMAEADRRKDQFLALLGHELRNPLAPIMTGLELLRVRFTQPGARVDDSMMRSRDVIERQSQHLSRLVDDLLDISRISSGKIELRKAPVAVQEIVELAINTSRPIVDERRHELQVHVPSEPLVVCGDTVRLVQVLANLLNNAARYTPDCGKISVHCERKGNEVELRVRDNGRGISPEFLPHVFDAFSQEEARAGSGLGLGLSVVRQLVMMHDGSVAVKSDGSGRGSEFSVLLPLDQSSTKPAEAKRPESAPPAAGRALSIVLIDDSEDIRELMAELFRGWGHHVEVAADGESGSELALRSQPDIAFVDIGLPRIDGYTVAEQLRTQLSRDRLRLVAMTGFGQESDKRRALDAGFDLHIVKPASIEALKRALAF